MEKKNLITIACAIGAGMGTLAANLWGFTWFGYLLSIVSGGIIAYLIYDIERVKAGAKQAYATVTAERKKKVPKPKNLPYERYKRLLRTASYWHNAEMNAFLAPIMMFLAFLGSSAVLCGVPVAHPFIIAVFLSYGAGVGCGLFALNESFIASNHRISSDQRDRIRLLRKKKSFRWIEKYCSEVEAEIAEEKSDWGMRTASPIMLILVAYNPLVTPLYFAGAIIVKNAKPGMIWCAKALLWLIIAIPKFTWLLLKNIHSDRRLLCFFDAMLGAAVGIHFHNDYSVIIGMIAGAVIGRFSYELISVRLLKLAR